MMKPTPMVIIFNMSRLIKARTNNNSNPVHKNATTSMEGSRSEIPKINASIEGMVAACMNTTANHPIVSDETLAALSIKNRFIFSISNTVTFFVEDVSSDLGDSWFVPSWVDVVCMIV